MDYDKLVEFEQFIIAQAPIVKPVVPGEPEYEAIGNVIISFMIHEKSKSEKAVNDVYMRLWLGYHLSIAANLPTTWLQECYEKAYGKLAPVFDLANMTGI